MDGRWNGPHGIGVFSREILSRLSGVALIPKSPPPLHPWNPVWLNLLLRRRRPRVYFTPGFNPPLGRPCPFVFTIHDLIHLEFPEETSLARRLYYRMVVRPACRRAWRVLTVSEFSRRRISAWARIPPEKIVVIRQGVGPPFHPEGQRWRPGWPYLLHVGNHKPHKNLPRLLAAFGRLRAAHPRLRLLLTGRPEAFLQEEIRRQGLDGRVEFAGTISENRLASLYRAAEALVLPSLYEGFGRPVLEAMACGTPVLCSRQAALQEVAGPAAVYVDPRHVESIAAGMRRILRDSGLRRNLRQRGRARARRFRWPEAARLVQKILAEAARHG